MTDWQPHATFDGVIDVNHSRGNIDWPSVKAGGIDLAFIKATQGSGFHDPLFAANRKDALAAGLMVVPYHFLDDSPVQKQVQNFRFVVNPVAGMPCMIDWEVNPATNTRAPVETLRIFGTVIEAIIKRAPVAYHSLYDLPSPIINAWPYFCPKYGPQPQGFSYLFWQYTDKGAVPGISVPVDRSRFSGNANELQVWYKNSTLPEGF
jgi:lysozyme